MVARWDDTGTVIPAGEAKYTVAEQPIAEYDNWINYNLVTDIQAVIDDVINKFNANTILKADSDNTPTALAVAASTFVGRKAAGSIAAMTAADARTVLNSENGADVTDSANVNAAGAVMEDDFAATTFLYAASDNTPQPKTPSEVRGIINVENGSTADQSNAEIRTAVGAAADSNVFTDAYKTKVDNTAVYDGTNVFSGAAPTSWTDLDLSAVTGSNRCLVTLKIKSTSGGVNYNNRVSIRPHGDTDNYVLEYTNSGAMTSIFLNNG